MKRLFSSILMLLLCGSAQAMVITYDFTWSGADGFSMDGMFTYKNIDASDGFIKDTEVTFLSFSGYDNGVLIETNNTAHLGADFNFNFDSVAGQFLLGGSSYTDSGQIWNEHAPTIGFVAGSAASALTINSTYPGWIENPSNLMAILRVEPVPEPTTILLFGIGLLGLARANRKKANSLETNWNQ